MNPNSPGHYGAGSVGYSAWQVVLQQHPWLGAYFRGHNWATILVRDPNISLWVAGYYLQFCRQHAANWTAAYCMYRYGAPQDRGRYAHRIQFRMEEVRYWMHAHA